MDNKNHLQIFNFNMNNANSILHALEDHENNLRALGMSSATKIAKCIENLQKSLDGMEEAYNLAFKEIISTTNQSTSNMIGALLLLADKENLTQTKVE